MTITQSSTRLLALTLSVAVVAVTFFAVLATPAHAAGVCPNTWVRQLQLGMSGADVMKLQQFLNTSAATQVAASGAGSPGSETSYFGGLTKAAVVKFQAANGIDTVGRMGPQTMAKINSLCTGSTPTPTPIPGGQVTVSAAAQPVNSLAVAGASRVPFTTFTLTNNSAAPVTINSVTVQRTGLGVDANFSGVVLLDSNGLQIGNAKTFNSNHQANIGDTGFTLAAGASMTFTVAGNMANSSTVQSGQVVSLQVVAINSSAVISGSLPITGASQTINNTLTLGSFSTTTSSVIPRTGTGKTQNIGDTAVRFSGLKFTAASAEDLKLYSVRWRQTGSASSVDISNVVTVANGTTYPTTVDSTGKYYTTVFPGGISIPKGNSIDVYVQGDLIGSNSASRTVIFTIDRATDVYFVGQTYGYGVADTVYPNSQPWYAGDTFTINAGTASTISKSNASADAAQNIAVNVPNQPLGGFVTNFLGEPVSVSGMTFSVATSTGNPGVLTSVSIVDENGSVVAGPVDGTTGTSGHTLVFSDTMTFPTGTHTYHVRGKVPTTWSNGATVTVTVTPTNWTNPTGQVSGNSITISNSAFALNQMTVRSATSSITVASSPTGQNIVAGVQGYTFANIQLDASQSGEDVRMSSLPVVYTSSGTTPDNDLSGCQLFDGATALTTGSRVINSTGATTATLSFSFDNSLTIPKGTVKNISVVCNVSSSASSGATYQFGIAASGYTATGVTSGVSITPSIAAAANGGAMVIASGSATVAVDSSSPAYALKAAGATGVTASVLKFRATNEALNLTKIGLTLVNSVGGAKSRGAAANSGTNGGVDDVVQAYIYNGATLVGTATFTGSNLTATSTLTTPVALAKDADTLLTVKVDLANISVSASGGIGDVVKVDPLNFEASGVSSGSTITGPTATNTVGTGAAGVQMYKSYPTLALVSNPTNPLGTAAVIKKFSVTANAAGPVGLYQVAVTLATSSANVANLKLFAYTDSSFSSPANVSGTTAGQFGGTAPLWGSATETTGPTVSFFQTTPLQIPTGSTYYFSLVGNVSVVGTATSWTVQATVLGDAATTTSLANYNVNTVTAVITHTGHITGVATSSSASKFIWSDNATTTAAVDDVDWANGYTVPGLSSSGF
ncbi:MAG: peptidoglycan-binding domain-containing protein [Patescibacteria group bacterium]